VINPIKPNIGLGISSEPSPESFQIVQNFAGWKLSVVYANETNLNVKLTKNLGCSQKSVGAMTYPAPR